MSERTNIEKELQELGSRLPAQAPPMPYAVPTGYFEGLAEQVLRRIRQEDARAELEALSPLLSQLSKQTPYSVTAGYFEKQSGGQQPAPIVSIATRRWIRYAVAVAAVFTGVLVWLNSDRTPQIETGSAQVLINEYQKDIQSLDEKRKAQLDEFIAAGLTGQETAQVDDTPQNNLLSDVSEQEITEFFEQSEYLTSSSDNE